MNQVSGSKCYLFTHILTPDVLLSASCSCQSEDASDLDASLACAALQTKDRMSLISD